MNKQFNYYISPKIDTMYRQWVIKFILESVGLKTNKDIEINENTHLIYGEPESSINEATICIPYQADDLLNEPILAGSFNKQLLSKFDIISAIGNFLMDTPNKNKTKRCYDSHDRLNSLNSFQYEKGYQDKPIVNLYVNYLKEVMANSFDFDFVPLFPKGIKSVIILSHDVDDPLKYAMLDSYKLFPKNLSVKQLMLYHMEAVKKTFEKTIQKDKDIYWVFEDVMNSESKHGFKSTFFFASRNRFDKHANFKEDVPYNIDTKEFKLIFQKMNSNGFEIGLHASYFAKNDSIFLKNEIEKLERISEKKLVGNRHHFWQIGPNPELTLSSHVSNGLLYDSSLAFNDAPGYRRSVALPYFLFDKNKEQVIENMQIPTFMMDSNFMKNPKFGQDHALDQARHYIDEFHKIGGVGAIDWHVRTSSTNSNRFKKWGEVYIQILEYLSKHEDIWVTNFETFYQWMTKRNKELYKSIKAES